MIHLLAGVLAAARPAALDTVTLGEVLGAVIPTAVGVVIVALVRVTYGRIEESIKGLGAQVGRLIEEVGAGKVADAEIRGRLDALEHDVESLRREVEARPWFGRRKARKD